MSPWNSRIWRHCPPGAPASFWIALTVKVPGQFLHPLDTEIESVHYIPVSDSYSLIVRHMLNVWAVPHEDLLAVVSTLYDSHNSSIVLKLLPKHGESKTFPYINPNGLEAFIIDTPTQTLAEKSVNLDKVCCFQCRVLIKPEDVRAHVGGLIFKSLHGVPVPNIMRTLHYSACGG
ncbi:hypothetical protein B0H14DRAFT_2581643 [Mycena olivaceomarginata]|nr:hypothetical protein B0H14DRAFT_2581643 [Mycena olivaceomarginata]